MKKYVEYKDSGIDWLGKIPSAWEIKKVKLQFDVINGATPKSGEETFWDGDIMWVTPADYKTKDMYLNNSRRCITKSGLNSCGTSLVPKNSIIISNRAPIGSVALAAKELCTSQGCKSLVKKAELDDKYNYYFFSIMSNPLNMLGRGTTFLELSSSDLKNFYIPTPPLQNQQAIADYLDRKTAGIEALISDKQKLIDLLREKRQDTISEAVIKGLDKSVKMKDSGIDWIGEIPSDWDVLPLFAVANENRTKNIGNNCANLLSLSYGNIINKDIETNFGLLPESFENYQIVEEGYTILRLTDLQNDKRSLRSGYVREKGIITSAYVGLVPSKKVDGLFLSELLHGYDLMKIFYGLGNGVRQSMNYSDLKRLPIIVPPLEKQREISTYLDQKMAQIDSLISDTAEQIEKLKEYRQSIISEAATGKVAV